MLARIVADLVAAGSLKRGDEIITPWSWPTALKVAEIRNPGARDLSTAVLTADGGRVHNDRHNFALDDDGKIIDDGIAPIHYEQWWGRGLRFAGTAHPLSRGMIDVEVAG